MNTITVGHERVTPSKIVCIGRNYVDHIQELDNEVPDDMVVFLKPNSAISTQLSAYQKETLHYEGEISLLVENGCFTAVGFGLDLTKRELQAHLKDKGLPWERAKAFDGAAVFSDFVRFDGECASLSLALSINNTLVQSGAVEHMMFKPKAILAQLPEFLTLNDGDIVMTGTPKGVGPMSAGDTFEGCILRADEVLVEGRWVAQ